MDAVYKLSLSLIYRRLFHIHGTLGAEQNDYDVDNHEYDNWITQNIEFIMVVLQSTGKYSFDADAEV